MSPIGARVNSDAIADNIQMGRDALPNQAIPMVPSTSCTL